MAKGRKKLRRDLTTTVQLDVRDLRQRPSMGEKAYVTVIRGSAHDLGRSKLVEKAITVGRDLEAGLPLKDHGVSRLHARIERQADGLYALTDLESTNGTRVNGAEVPTSCALRSGDKIFIGETVLRFAVGDEIELAYQLEVAEMVGQDHLTGLESKRRFDDALAFCIENARRSGRSLSLLMMDLDGVKPINDTHGHLFGAHVIREAGRIVARHLTAGGHACRFGGDEFTVFLPGVAKKDALQIAEAIRLSIDGAEMEKDGIALAPTISIGVASYPDDADTPVDLLAKADSALYRAKGLGKNRVEA
jgi:diguanylate cyclase (GGDEF)-like protein